MTERKAEDAREVGTRAEVPGRDTLGRDTLSAAGSARYGPGARTQPCPVCGHTMPDLKGGKGSICGVCGFKDSCCY
jgi:hypothetical protein